jgi:sorbose reductase
MRVILTFIVIISNRKYDDYKYVYDTNVFGQFVCAQQAAALWQEKGYKKGSIVFTSSMSSQIVNKVRHSTIPR